jgi:Galactose oxidase, central domain
MKRSITVMMVLLTSMFYAFICQAQILGTGQLGTARRSHSAILLQDGKILIVGGDDANGLVGQAEIFDPISLTSSIIAATPVALRTDHTATLLSDGRVLIIGGVDSNGLLSSTEFYNPYAVPAPSFTAGPALLRAQRPYGDSSRRRKNSRRGRRSQRQRGNFRSDQPKLFTG